MSSKVVLFRCNASEHIGAGHVMRCLSLAQRLRAKNLRCVFLTNHGGIDLIQHHAPDSFQVIETDIMAEIDQELIQVASEVSAFYIVWDSYEVTEIQVANVAAHTSLMMLDDIYSLSYYDCDAILNQNLYANSDKYNTNKDTTVLAGSKYALLRNHFLRKTYNIKGESDKLSILLTFGGSDPTNLSCLILRWLTSLQVPVRVSVVIGQHFSYEQELYTLIEEVSEQLDVKSYRNVIQIAELFLQQDLVICAGGSTVYELACLGIPMCSIVTAENQLELTKTADEIGFCKSLGNEGDLVQSSVIQTIQELLSNEANRDEMSRIGQQTVDGKGAQRVAEYIQTKLS
jgi:UDP-2,4-diacetamido-2,4,6-trideoxy-beta-L-altropyranose hydrolase